MFSLGKNRNGIQIAILLIFLVASCGSQETDDKESGIGIFLVIGIIVGALAGAKTGIVAGPAGSMAGTGVGAIIGGLVGYLFGKLIMG